MGNSSITNSQTYYNGMGWVTTYVYNYSTGIKRRANKDYKNQVRDSSLKELNKTIDKYGKKKSNRAKRKIKEETDRHNRLLYITE